MSLVYIFYFSFLVIGAVVLNKKYSRAFLFLAMAFLALIIGCRSVGVGVDTVGYVNDFMFYQHIDYPRVLEIMKTSKEPLFVLGSYFVSVFTSSSIWFTLFWGALPCIALYYVLKNEIRFARGLLVSILIIFALGLFAFFVAGMRQTAAISVTLLAYKCLILKEVEYKLSFLFSKQVILFVALMVVAYNLHNSSVLFLLILPFLKFRVSWWYLPIVISMFFIGNYVTIDILTEMSAMFFEDRFSSYGTVYESSQSISAFVMQLLLLGICFFQREKLMAEDERNGYLFNILVIGLGFQALSGMIAEMFRVSFYFSIFACVLVPKAIEKYPKSFRNLLYSAFCGLMFFYLFFLSGSNLPEYHFAL